MRSYREGPYASKPAEKFPEIFGGGGAGRGGNKAQALDAKLADDKKMERTAMRIRARAVSRCGDLLQEFEKGKTGPKRLGGGVPTQLNRSEAATEAGLSKDQAVQAIRVSNVPKEDFEEQVESDSPPTITALAEQGKAKGIPRKGRECAGFWKGEGLDHLEVPIAQERVGATGFEWLSRVGTLQMAGGAKKRN